MGYFPQSKFSILTRCLIVMAEFFESRRGGRKMSCDGFLYIVHRVNDETTVWRCVNYQKGCKGRVYQNETNIQITQEHNHMPNIVECETSKIKTTSKQDLGSQPRTIVNQCMVGVSDQILVSMPKLVSLEKKVNRARKVEDI